MKPAVHSDDVDVHAHVESSTPAAGQPQPRFVRHEFATYQHGLAHAALIHGEPGAARAALRVLAADDFANAPEAAVHLDVLRASVLVPDDRAVRAIATLVAMPLYLPRRG